MHLPKRQEAAIILLFPTDDIAVALLPAGSTNHATFPANRSTAVEMPVQNSPYQTNFQWKHQDALLKRCVLSVPVSAV